MKEVSNVGIEEDANNTTEEVEIMVRKAETLKSLDELNLSDRTKAYLDSNFGYIEGIIREGRIDAFEQDLGTQPKYKTSKWKSELILALRDAGFIRPTTDFLMTFCISHLYSVVYDEWKDYFVTDIGQLSNEQYEEFLSLSAQCIEDVKSLLRERLSGKEYEVLTLRFGLDYTGVFRTFESVGKHLNTVRTNVCRYEARALRKLRHPSTKLPAIFEVPIDLEEAVVALRTELDELYESPAFKRANEITRELEHVEKAPFNMEKALFDMENEPFRYTCKRLRALDNTHIEELNLSIRAYNCLKRAGICTISDIINLPKENWFKLRNFGRKDLEDVVEKMHFAGYEDFSVRI